MKIIILCSTSFILWFGTINTSFQISGMLYVTDLCIWVISPTRYFILIFK